MKTQVQNQTVIPTSRFFPRLDFHLTISVFAFLRGIEIAQVATTCRELNALHKRLLNPNMSGDYSYFSNEVVRVPSSLCVRLDQPYIIHSTTFFRDPKSLYSRVSDMLHTEAEKDFVNHLNFLAVCGDVNTFQNLFTNLGAQNVIFLRLFSKRDIAHDQRNTGMNPQFAWSVAKSGNGKLCEFMLSQDIDPTTSDREHKDQTALHCASGSGHAAIVKQLLAYTGFYSFKLNIDARSSDPLYPTALHLAAANGHAENVKMLCEAKADLSIRNSQGRTALQCCLAARITDDNKTAVFDLLFDGKEQVDDFGKTLIHLALVSGSPISIIRPLLAGGTAINEDGSHVFHFAAHNAWDKWEHQQILELLTENFGGLFDKANKNGQIPLELAIQNRAPVAIRFFLNLHLEQARRNNCISPDFLRALRLLARTGDVDSFIHIFEFFKKVNLIIQEFVHEVWHSAVSSGNRSLVKMFVDHRVDVNTQDSQTKRTALLHCIASDVSPQAKHRMFTYICGLMPTEYLQEILRDPTFFLFAARHATPLAIFERICPEEKEFWCGYAQSKETSGTKAALQMLDIDFEEKRRGFSECEETLGMNAFHVLVQNKAITNDVLEFIRTKLQFADINAKDAQGRTALYFAVLSSNPLAIKFLLAHHADVFIQFDDSDILKSACQLIPLAESLHDSQVVLRLLIQHYHAIVSAERTSERGHAALTALKKAAVSFQLKEYRNLPAFEMLLETCPYIFEHRDICDFLNQSKLDCRKVLPEEFTESLPCLSILARRRFNLLLPRQLNKWLYCFCITLRSQLSDPKNYPDKMKFTDEQIENIKIIIDAFLDAGANAVSTIDHMETETTLQILLSLDSARFLENRAQSVCKSFTEINTQILNSLNSSHQSLCRSILISLIKRIISQTQMTEIIQKDLIKAAFLVLQVNARPIYFEFLLKAGVKITDQETKDSPLLIETFISSLKRSSNLHRDLPYFLLMVPQFGLLDVEIRQIIFYKICDILSSSTETHAKWIKTLLALRIDPAKAYAHSTAEKENGKNAIELLAVWRRFPAVKSLLCGVQPATPLNLAKVLTRILFLLNNSIYTGGEQYGDQTFVTDLIDNIILHTEQQALIKELSPSCNWKFLTDKFTTMSLNLKLAKLFRGTLTTRACEEAKRLELEQRAKKESSASTSKIAKGLAAQMETKEGGLPSMDERLISLWIYLSGKQDDRDHKSLGMCNVIFAHLMFLLDPHETNGNLGVADMINYIELTNDRDYILLFGNLFTDFKTREERIAELKAAFAILKTFLQKNPLELAKFNKVVCRIVGTFTPIPAILLSPSTTVSESTSAVTRTSAACVTMPVVRYSPLNPLVLETTAVHTTPETKPQPWLRLIKL